MIFTKMMMQPPLRTAYIEFRYYPIENRPQQYIELVLKQQRELFFGLIRIHVLVHASHEPIFGLAMMDELTRHGYRIGPGTDRKSVV